MNLHQWKCFASVAVGYVFWCAMVEPAQGRRCAFQINKTEGHMTSIQAGSVNGSEQTCTHSDCCVAYYHLINDQPVLDFMACTIFDIACPMSTCQAYGNLGMVSCLCSADLCNAQLTWNREDEQHDSYSNVAFIAIPIGTFLVLCIGVVKWRQRFRFQANDLLHDPIISVERPKTDFADIELQQIVGRGRFATVWQGKYQGGLVAVKVFSAASKREFTSEKEVYELPLLNHPGILCFLGAGSGLQVGEWMILLELAAKGSLHSFLSTTTSDWVSSLKLSLSMSQGLAYLHSDLHRQGVHKPPVAHRDLSSANVFVRADGSCALGDFNLSTVIGPCTGHHRGQCHLDTTVLRRVGTPRYMAPEIMEGAVNLGFGCTHGYCFLEADMYALALLLWEIWSRCSDMFEGDPVPQHYMPYEAELEASGIQISLIQYVSEMRKRPSIPPHWKESRQGFALQEIMTDCWDHEPQGRLQAQCVVDRLLCLSPPESSSQYQTPEINTRVMCNKVHRDRLATL